MRSKEEIQVKLNEHIFNYESYERKKLELEAIFKNWSNASDFILLDKDIIRKISIYRDLMEEENEYIELLKWIIEV